MSDNRSEKQRLHAEAIMPLICERLAAGQHVRNLSFSGVSMMPMLRQGRDSVELAPLPEKLQKYDLTVYSGPDGKYVMHRVVEAREGLYICRGDNTYHDERVAPERMRAVVCAFTRGDRRISVENRAYRVYVRVWCALYPARRLLKRTEWLLKRVVRRVLK